MYLAISEEAFKTFLVREIGTNQSPVYFCSKALAGPETRYQNIEKVVLALMVVSKKLLRYFLAHPIVVRTDQLLKHVLFRPDLTERMTKWSIELSEFDIMFEEKKALKAQTFTNFQAEFTPPTLIWVVFKDESSNTRDGVRMNHSQKYIRTGGRVIPPIWILCHQ